MPTKFIKVDLIWPKAEERPLVQRFDGKVATFKVVNRPIRKVKIRIQKYKKRDTAQQYATFRVTSSLSRQNQYISYMCSSCFTSPFTLKDGSTAEVDVIMMCTGYLHSYPFLRLDSFLKLSLSYIWSCQGGAEDEVQEPVLPTRALQGG